MKNFSKIFDRTSPGPEAARALMGLQQGARSVSDYAIEFHTLAVDSGWTDSSLWDAFHQGLSDAMHNLLIALDSLIALTDRLDNRVRERDRVHRTPTPRSPGSNISQLQHRFLPSTLPTSSSSAPPVPLEEPMQLGCSRLTPEGCQRHLVKGRCVYCALKGHFLASCPVRAGSSMRKRTQVSCTEASTPSPHL